MMQYRLHWLDAYRGLKTRPFRSVLTLLSLSLGVGALFVLLQLKCLAHHQIKDMTSALGPRVVSVWWAGKHSDKTVTVGKLESLNQQTYLSVYPFASTSLSATYGDESLSGRVVALSKPLMTHVQWPLQQGTLAVDEHYPWVWVGARLAIQYKMAVGDTIWIENQGFKLAGIFQPLPINPIFDFDINSNMVVMMKDVMMPWQPIEHALIYFSDQWEVTQVKQVFTNLFKSTFGDYKLFFKDESLLSHHIRQAMASYQNAFTWIAIVASVLALVSLFAQQWLSFLERRGECGMRMSMGATRLELLSLFINESLILGVIGASVGLIIGAVVLFYLSLQLQWPMTLDYTLFGITFGGCVLMAGLAGVIPAATAALSSPKTLLAS